MNKIIDSNTNSLVDLVEEYIDQKRNRVPSNTSYFQNELKGMGYSPDQVHDLLIEINDDADKELLAGIGIKKAKRNLTLSIAVGVFGMVLTIAGALGVIGIRSFGLSIVPFGLIGGSFIIAGKAYAELGLVKKRKKRRFLKYHDWR